MTRFHFHHQCNQLKEARGWAGALILNETRRTIFLKRLAVSSGKLEVWIPYNISSTTARLVSMWSNTENKCIIPPFLQRTSGDKGRKGSQTKGDVTDGMIRNDDFECHKNVPKMFSIVAILSQHCYPTIRRCKSPRVTSPYKIFLGTNMFLFKAVFFFFLYK